MGSAAAAFALAAMVTAIGDQSFFVSAAAGHAPGVTSHSDHRHSSSSTASAPADQQHEMSPRNYRSVAARYYPGPILRSAAKLGGEQNENSLQALQATPMSMEPSSIVMNSFEHRGLLRSRSSTRRRMEDLGLAGDASIASNEELEPGTPGGWWEKLYVSGEYPEGRRGASAAVFRVTKCDENNDDGSDDANTNGRRTASTAMSGENRPAPHTTSHAGASSSTAAAEMTRTPPSPGDPLPIPGHMSPSSSTSSRTHWRPLDYDHIENEYMIVSGGFSDDDWSTFPVWALDMSGDSQPAEFRDSYKWVNLGGSTDNGPEARVGHMSAIHEGQLYVFGGLLYNHANFFFENGAFVWRARIDGQLPPSAKTSEELNDKEESNSILDWERLIPKIVDPISEGVGDKPSSAVDGDGRFEPIRSRPINEGEAGGNDDDDAPHDGPHDRRGLGAIPAKQATSPYRLPRGEIQGGHWHPTNPDGDHSIPRSAYIFYGGLHVSHIRKYTANSLLQIDEPLGDVWMYVFGSNEFHRLAPYPPESWQTDPITGLYPEARTAHGATVVGNKLIIHGGMKINTDAISYNGETNWDPLSDCWEFDLVERVWRQRIIEPKLARSYHSLVGWGDGSIAAFGGYRSADTIAGDAIAFVFSDVLVNHPDEDWWLKAQWPQIYAARTISNRLEHISVVDKEGSMFAWGGRFKTTSQVSGTWKIDVFNEDSTVIMAPAPPDGYDAYEAELEALHLLVAVMMFMSIIFTALYGSVRRQQMEMAAAVEGNATAPGVIGLAGIRRSGLPQATVDSFPVKIYNRNDKATEEGKDGELDESNFVIDSEDDNAGGTNDASHHNQGGTTGLQGLEEEETCPICLVEYEDGDEVRTLSCGHLFHKDCIDQWLSEHTSCPGCRQNFSNSTFDTIPTDANNNDLVEENFDPTWENLRRSVWGEAPAFLSPQMVSLANILASYNGVPTERPGEPPDSPAAPQDASRSSMAVRPDRSSAESLEIEDQDEFTNDEDRMTDRGMRRPPRLRLGRARGYRSVRPQVSSTEMVEISTGSASVV